MLGIIEEAVAPWVSRFGDPRVLLLGVTPEYFHLWPEGTDLLAIDKNPSMIANVWPGPPGNARCDNWLTMDVPDGSRDIALCDGGIPAMIPHPDQRPLIENIRRILSPSGLLVMRCFVLPDSLETTAQVLEELTAGKISNINALKMRLWVSVSKQPREGVRVSDIWKAVDGAVPDLDALSAQIGWPPQDLRQLENYRDTSERFYFQTVDEFIGLIVDEIGGFRHLDTQYPGYELGERCPVLVFEKE